MTVFGSGPRLDEPSGEVGRQAVAALRGYAYQIYVSAVAWLGLTDQQTLYLEVAEDYAVASREALAGTQVKDTRASGRITLQSDSVRSAIDSLVDLIARNPNRTVSLHYLTTSEIGIERETDHRIEGESALRYWRRAAAGADLAPLKSLIAALSLKPATRDYLAALSDTDFRTNFLARIHWHCGAPALNEVRVELEAGLIEYVSSARKLSSHTGKALVPIVVETVFRKAVSPKDRHLHRADLLGLIDDASRVSVPIEQFSDVFGGRGHIGGGFSRSSLLLPASDIPLPEPCAPRADLVALIDRHRLTSGAVWAVGATGLGKSLLARLVASATGAQWAIVDFRNLNAGDTASRLVQLSGELVTGPPEGLILDDLNEIDDPRVRDLSAGILSSLRRRDITIVITAYRPPTPTTLHALQVDGSPIVRIPYLEKDEVADLVAITGGDARYATQVYSASVAGHPQLTMALVQILSQSGWAEPLLAGLTSLDGFDGLSMERRATRQRLMAGLPKEAGTLLLRTSLVGGGFDRGMAMALSEISPPVPYAGLSLDQLIGAWIENLPRGHMRVSPLIEGAASEVLTETECRAIHHCIAERIFQKPGIPVSDVDLLTRHALASGEVSHVVRLAISILTASEDLIEPRFVFRNSSKTRLQCPSIAS